MSTFQLPQIPPRPPFDPPRDAAEREAWKDAWDLHIWATNLHMQEGVRQAQVATGLELAADLPPRRIGKGEVVLACIRAVPPTIKPTENGWAGDVKTLADQLWLRMQADPEINPLKRD